MTRRGAQPSRQQQAFDMLLDQQYAAQNTNVSDTNNDRAKGQRRGKQASRAIVDKRGSDRVPAFALRDSLPADNSPSHPSPAQEQLNSMFGSVLDKSIINEVLLSCNSSVEAATDKLLALSEHNRAQAPSRSQQATPTQPEGVHLHTKMFHTHKASIVT